MKVSTICIEVFFSLIWVIRVPYITKTIVFFQFDKIAPRQTKLLKNCENENNIQFPMCVYLEKNHCPHGLSGSPGHFFFAKGSFSN